MSYPILDVVGLSKSYGTFAAVRDISFRVQEGEIVGLLGPNGAGKSTTIQMLLGLTAPTSGSISYFGKNLEDHRSEILEKINYVSAFASLQARATVRENLKVFAMLYGVEKPGVLIEELSQKLGITKKLDSLYMSLSSGEKTRANLVKSFLNNPKLILMDEPTASLDPEIVDVVLELIEVMRREKHVAILYTSHNMSEISRICDRVIFLQHGKILAVDTPLGLTKRVGDALLRITFDADHKKVEKYLMSLSQGYVMDHTHVVEIHCEEKMIPKILHGFAKRNIEITDIEIEKPNLEDVFLAVARKGEHALF